VHRLLDFRWREIVVGRAVGWAKRSVPTRFFESGLKQAIVAQIEAEQALVNANHELITRFEQKLQAILARVWGEDAG